MSCRILSCITFVMNYCSSPFFIMSIYCRILATQPVPYRFSRNSMRSCVRTRLPVAFHVANRILASPCSSCNLSLGSESVFLEYAIFVLSVPLAIQTRHRLVPCCASQNIFQVLLGPAGNFTDFFAVKRAKLKQAEQCICASHAKSLKSTKFMPSHLHTGSGLHIKTNPSMSPSPPQD